LSEQSHETQSGDISSGPDQHGSTKGEDGFSVSVVFYFDQPVSSLPDALETAARRLPSGKAILFRALHKSEADWDLRGEEIDGFLRNTRAELSVAGIDRTWLHASGSRLRVYISLKVGPQMGDMIISNTQLLAWAEIGAELRIDAI
jgi:hypothetical protein